ncbi:EutN/CcmL family microcompartment protein [bacterium]|jgi:microcompartment protein CcmK/EutM|nr:EutN/CcmL family microcompartment protein [bacterium]
MKLAIVTKKVISTIKHPVLDGRKLYMVQPVNPWGTPDGEPFVTIDTVRSTVGSLVLVDNEGGGSQEVLQVKNEPVQSVIVGIVEHIRMNLEEPGK